MVCLDTFTVASAQDSGDDADEDDADDGEELDIDAKSGQEPSETRLAEKKYYGCVREDYVANGIKMIKVEIPEPEYYSEYRAYCESNAN